MNIQPEKTVHNQPSFTRRWITILACLSFCLLITGCATEKPAEPSNPQETTEPTPAASAPSAEPASPAPEDRTLQEASGPLHVEDGELRNEAGQPVQLRGVSTHGLAWFPEYVNEDSFRTLRDDWNVNTVRLAMYTGENGGYCTGGDRAGLLDVIDRGVAYTEQLGMYAIIDWHILSDGNPRDHEAEAAAFFDALSKKYAEKDHVLYEICNEPQNAPFTAVIRPYAEHLISVIRQNDSDAVILVGTNTWSQDIDEVIGNELADPNVMYTLHFYAGTHKDKLRAKLERAVKAGVPVYISECSICDASGSGAVDKNSAEKWLELIRKYGLSFNAWSLCNKNETSALIKASCAKTGSWTADDLSETGTWFRNTFNEMKKE